MNQDKKTSKQLKIAYWLSTQLITAGFAVFIALYLLQKTAMRFEWAMPIMVAWGALGATIHYLSIKRGNRFRMRWNAVFAVATVAAGIGLAYAFDLNLADRKPCPVCGFMALEAEGTQCPVCKVALTPQAAAAEGYATTEELLHAEQIMYFLPTDTGRVDFYAPCDCPEHFVKSPTWAPVVTAEEVLEIQRLAAQATQ